MTDKNYKSSRWCSLCGMWQNKELATCPDCGQRTRSKPRHHRGMMVEVAFRY